MCTVKLPRNDLSLHCRRKTKQLSKKELSNVAPASGTFVHCFNISRLSLSLLLLFSLYFWFLSVYCPLLPPISFFAKNVSLKKDLFCSGYSSSIFETKLNIFFIARNVVRFCEHVSTLNWAFLGSYKCSIVTTKHHTLS